MSKDPTDTESTAAFTAVLTDYTYKTYTKDGKTMSTGQIDTIKNTVSNGANMAGENIKSRYNYAYDYDANNNIVDEYTIDNYGVRHTMRHYNYDEANQLTQVTDYENDKTYAYKYNGGGNRTSTEIYNSTNAVVGVTEPAKTITAEYGNGLVVLAPWNDRLKKYDGKEITYDGAGNPVSYDGKTYEWTGKQLTKVTAQDGSYTTYSYDTEGLRTKKMQYDANGQMEYQVGYIWSDGKIITQSLGLIIRGTSGGKPTETQVNLDTKYLYEDGSNAPYAVMVNNGEYLFVRNAQGDVTAVVDVNGDTLAEYSYDAWGNVTATYVDDNDLFKAIMCLVCPLTYRGYNYDFTTGLYYLQSRYYNPEWGRFLNVDDVKILASSAGDPLAANMYAYCNNNPVNFSDYTGHWGKEVHYYDTMFWAKDFFYSSDAIIIAEANLNMDSFLDGNHATFPSQQRYHFNRNPRGAPDSRSLFAIFSVFIAALYWVETEYKFENSSKKSSDYILRDMGYLNALVILGKGLHSLQDYEGHGNIGMDSFYAQHIISINGSKVYRADNINYSWVAGSNRTQLVKDPNKTRYNITKNDTYNYFEVFIMLVSVYRAKKGLPYIPLNGYTTLKLGLKYEKKN